MKRRQFIQTGTAALGGLLLAACSQENPPLHASPTGDKNAPWHMPDEGDPHTRTWMAFGASEKIWGTKLLPQVRRDLALIATTIARFEPVSMLVRPEEKAIAAQLIGNAAVKLISAELDDLWMRDTGAVFVKHEKSWGGVNFNFNGWGKKQAHQRDAAVSTFIAHHSGARLIETDLVLEGGGIEVDGRGTAIITESCVLNSNRNPGWKRKDVEAELNYLLGIKKIIWLPGIAGKDITDGHTDFYARFAQPGVVVAGLDNDPQSFDYNVTRKHLEILSSATDAQGRKITVEVIPGPDRVREKFVNDDFAAGYINFYVCNGAVIAPEFGDPAADGRAHSTLSRIFPGRKVLQLNIDAIAAGGGGIHCTTQQEPTV